MKRPFQARLVGLPRIRRYATGFYSHPAEAYTLYISAFALSTAAEAREPQDRRAAPLRDHCPVHNRVWYCCTVLQQTMNDHQYLDVPFLAELLAFSNGRGRRAGTSCVILRGTTEKKAFHTSRDR